MMRTFVLSAVLLCVLVLATHAGAQSEMPTELWQEYPLVQTVERTETGTAAESLLPPDVGPFLPPDPEVAVAPTESTQWSWWLALLGLAAVATVMAARVMVPVAASGARHAGAGLRRLPARARPRRRLRPTAGKPKPVQLREQPRRPLAPVERLQYAPLPAAAVGEPDAESDARRSVVRRSGFLRSRFVVVADEPDGLRPLVRSRSFWSVGSIERRERAADHAWRALLRDLRAAGWEPDYWDPDSPGSAYYVLLRRADEGPSGILPTIEAYSLTSEDRADRS
jgi:hypothetical protein